MFVWSSLIFYQGKERAFLIVVALSLLVVGFFVQYCLCRRWAPVFVKLLPPAVSATALIILVSLSMGWLTTSLPFHNTIVRGGILRIWGVCIECFLAGALIGWITWLIIKRCNRHF